LALLLAKFLAHSTLIIVSKVLTVLMEGATTVLIVSIVVLEVTLCLVVVHI